MMHSANKFLSAIVVAVALLVVIAFTVVILRPEPSYQDDATPDGAAHNYLLAVQRQDYERAFSYLPSTFRYPQDAAHMAEDIRHNTWRFETGAGFSLAVESTRMQGEDRAIVTVRKTTFYNEGLFGSHQFTNMFTLDMVLENGQWQVTDGENYWSNCWGESRASWCP